MKKLIVTAILALPLIAHADEALLKGREYKQILALEFQWDAWACPKKSDGSLDHNKAMTGDDLIDFVNQLHYT